MELQSSMDADHITQPGPASQAAPERDLQSLNFS
jgi:hypothetical protein